MIIPNHDYTARERTVCEILAPLTSIRRMLNVGMRRPDDPRNHWWIKICKANGTESHVLEVFEPNCRELRAAGIENVTCGDVHDVARLYVEPFDVVLWWHGPEHLEKAETPAVIDALWRLTQDTLIVGCPLGAEPQGICYGNPHERHLSSWQPADFAAFGMQTVVVRDERPWPHITAWRRRDAVRGDAETRGQTAAVGERGEDAGERSQDAGERSERGQDAGARTQEKGARTQEKGARRKEKGGRQLLPIRHWSRGPAPNK